MSQIKRLINLYLYSSLHIGLGAFALTYLSFITFGLTIDYYYLLFVFCSTVFLYCLHRFIGIKKIRPFENKGRFDVIYHYRNHILFYAILSATGSIISLINFDYLLLRMLIVPSLVSLLYALPVFRKGKRLRDFGYIKIFLIAIIWSWITVFIPLHGFSEQIDHFTIAILSLERFLFFIAITIPFDLRDKFIDQRTDLKTIIHLMTAAQARTLCYALLQISSTLLLYVYSTAAIDIYYLISYVLTYIITSVLIYISREKKHDYYYTGLLDGTMLLPMSFYLILRLLA